MVLNTVAGFCLALNLHCSAKSLVDEVILGQAVPTQMRFPPT